MPRVIELPVLQVSGSTPTPICPSTFKLLTNVPTPVTRSPVVFPNILNPLAVTIPTESTLVTSSYVNVPPIDIVPGTVKSPFLLTLTLVKVVTPAVISLAKS